MLGNQNFQTHRSKLATIKFCVITILESVIHITMKYIASSSQTKLYSIVN